MGVSVEVKMNSGGMGASLSPATLRETDGLIRALVRKLLVVIVEARQGVKVKTSGGQPDPDQNQSRVSFNLSIKDIPEVLAEAKRSMAGQIPTAGLGMCVEISLNTADGHAMVLETWYLEMAEQCDPSVRAYTIYSRMSIMLKSLISVTRITPAYKVSTLHGPESFVMCYRVYMGEPIENCLGDTHKMVKVGQAATPIGTLILSVAYRTNLAFDPQNNQSKDCQFMVKSDHFKPDMSPKHVKRPSQIAFHKEHRSVVDELAAACQDNHPASKPAFTNGDRKPLSKNAKDNGNSPTCACNQDLIFSQCKKVGAFAEDLKKAENPELLDFYFPDAPFGSLFQPTANNCDNKNCPNNKAVSDNNNDDAPVPTAVAADSRSVASNTGSQESSSEASCFDDFVLVELKPPFANAEDGSPSELGAFFRDCQTTSTLSFFNEQPTFADQVGELTTQLANFESTMPDFDDFVETLRNDESPK